jgi:AraC-like DNA-binding protein
MYFQFFMPCPQLEPYIFEFVIMHNLDSGIPIICDKYVPGFGGGMVFHFQDPTRLLTQKQDIILPKQFLFAPPQKFLVMQPGKRFDILIVKFKPAGLRECLGISPLGIADQYYIDLENAFPNQISTLYEMMASENVPENRINHLETFLCNQLEKRKQSEAVPEYISYATQIIMDSKGCGKLSLLCKELKTDQRTFRRNFSSHIGICPKSFARLVRVNNIVNDIDCNPQLNINDIVFKYNYFDQSHLINDFKDILGETPNTFINKDKYFQKIISAHP